LIEKWRPEKLKFVGESQFAEQAIDANGTPASVSQADWVE
jgi:hypothetical protein